MSQPGVRNSLSILSALSRSFPVSFSELLEKSGCGQKSTLVRYLKPLQEEGWVVKKSSGEYIPGPKLRDVAVCIRQRTSVEEIVSPIVSALSDQTGQSAAYVEWLPMGGVVFRVKKEAPDAYHYLEVGQRNYGVFEHAFCLLALAYQARPVMDGMFKKHSIVSEEEKKPYIKLFEQARAERFLKGEDLGVRFAAPVFWGQNGDFCGIIGISLFPQKISAEKEREYRRLVIKAAEEASIKAGGSDYA